MSSQQLTGTIQKIIYQKNNFVVASVGNTKICGKLPQAEKGMKVTLFGRTEKHPQYGPQFSFTAYKKHNTNDYAYLASGLVRHIGPKLAKQIVEKIPNPIETILSNPPALLKIKGISYKRALAIHQSVKETAQYKDIAIDLAMCNLTPTTIIKIYDHFKTANKVLQNPYVLTELDLIGFKKADNIAQKLGIPLDSDTRIRAACFYQLNQAASEGHVFLTKEQLGIQVYGLLNKKIPPQQIEQAMANMSVVYEENRMYLPHLNKAENMVTYYLTKLQNKPFALPQTSIQSLIKRYPVQLSPEQSLAVRLAFENRILIITGGPGTGKTETIRAITNIYKTAYPNKAISLAAPTGRASRRMEEVTGLKAQTIHAMIAQKRNQHDLLIIDEASMVDIELFANLLPHLQKDVQLILVGDPNQLPPVGPGAVLHDVSNILPTIKLKQVFRQAQESNIITNAHRINRGELNLATGPDFVFQAKESSSDILKLTLGYVESYYQQRGSLEGLQVLSPMKKGALGTQNLNKLIQDIITTSGNPYNIGDRVVQLVNNYHKGVWNGEIGTITKVKPLTVNFDNKTVEYKNHEKEQITLGYALTVHKSQGSEYPTIIIPIHTQHFIMLTRQVLYTAITRAQQKAILIGNYKGLVRAIGNNKPQYRNSALSIKLQNP